MTHPRRASASASPSSNCTAVVACPGDREHRRREVEAPRRRAARTSTGRNEARPAGDVEHARAARNLRRIEQRFDERSGRAGERRPVDAGRALPARMLERANRFRIERSPPPTPPARPDAACRPVAAAADRTSARRCGTSGRSNSMLNQRCRCGPHGMSASVRSSPARYGCLASSAETMPQTRAASSTPCLIAAMSRLSGGVRTRPQNTTPIGRFSSVCCASIQRSTLARACGSCGHSFECGACAWQR